MKLKTLRRFIKKLSISPYHLPRGALSLINKIGTPNIQIWRKPNIINRRASTVDWIMEPKDFSRVEHKELAYQTSIKCSFPTSVYILKLPGEPIVYQIMPWPAGVEVYVTDFWDECLNNYQQFYSTPEEAAEKFVEAVHRWEAGLPICDSWVYFIQESKSGNIKIGWAKDVDKRCSELQCGNSSSLTVLLAISGTIDDEKRIQREFKQYHVRGEWYYPSPELLYCINQVLFDHKEYGIVSS